MDRGLINFLLFCVVFILLIVVIYLYNKYANSFDPVVKTAIIAFALAGVISAVIIWITNANPWWMLLSMVIVCVPIGIILVVSSKGKKNVSWLDKASFWQTENAEGYSPKNPPKQYRKTPYPAQM